jgi:hypothetical protein
MVLFSYIFTLNYFFKDKIIIIGFNGFFNRDDFLKDTFKIKIIDVRRETPNTASY